MGSVRRRSTRDTHLTHRLSSAGTLALTPCAAGRYGGGREEDANDNTRDRVVREDSYRKGEERMRVCVATRDEEERLETKAGEHRHEGAGARQESTRRDAVRLVELGDARAVGPVPAAPDGNESVPRLFAASDQHVDHERRAPAPQATGTIERRTRTAHTVPPPPSPRCSTRPQRPPRSPARQAARHSWPTGPRRRTG